MDKKTLLEALKRKCKVYAYIQVSDSSGGYIQLVKTDYMKTVIELSDNETFDNISMLKNAIYIN